MAESSDGFNATEKYSSADEEKTASANGYIRFRSYEFLK
jgi:hypothetical protein